MAALLIISPLQAENFAPNILHISAPSAIYYKFDETKLMIPVSITGTPASGTFLVFTKDQGEKISKIRNGYLGWHYVNKIDTCIYVSPPLAFTTGNNTIEWTGDNKNGAKVQPGDYIYYVWAFDNVNPRIQMSQYMTFAAFSFPTIITHDEAGMALSRPILYTASQYKRKETNYIKCWKRKWVIGSDPKNISFRESCDVMQVQDHGGLAFDPKNHNKFWVCYQANNGTFETKKFTWVPNGMAIQDANDQKWGNSGAFTYSTTHAPATQWGPGLSSDNRDFLFAANADAEAQY
jgi:hypothetical protein